MGLRSREAIKIERVGIFMSTTNVKFSEIDKETLVNYFLNDFKKKEDVEREEHETMFKEN